MNDMQIIRGQDNGYNLALGEPFFLIDALSWTYSLKVQGPFYYPLFSGSREFVEELQLLYPNKHIVVTNGAKQALAAALYAFRECEGYRSAYVPAPYWISYPTMIKSAGLMLEDRNEHKQLYKFLSIDTLVNNPDGRIANEKVDLLDCAYAHSVYGYDNTIMPEHRVSVWSAAKLFGLSGLRVGWAVFDDESLAHKAALFVEITTSGVAAISQQYMTQVLKHVRQYPAETKNLYDMARRTLNYNADMFNETLAPYCSIIKGASTERKGMFAYFKVNDNEKFTTALKNSNVLLVTGRACGESEDGWYRMSLGHRREITDKAFEVLTRELKK